MTRQITEQPTHLFQASCFLLEEKKNRRDQQRQRNVSPAAQWQIIHNLAQKFDLAAVNTVARPRPRLRPSPRRFVLVFFHSRFSLVGFSCAANTYFCLSSCLAIRRFA